MENTKNKTTVDYHALNAMLNLYNSAGEIQFEKDKEAAHHYFRQHVNQNTVFFHDLKEKLDFLVNENYYEPQVIEQYDFAFIKKLFKQAYAHKFRFQTFLGAFKYYTSYTLKTFDGKRYLERYFSVGLAFLISVSVSFVATFGIFAPSFLLPHRRGIIGGCHKEWFLAILSRLHWT